MSTFKVGDLVEWDSQAAGIWRTKRGEVVEVVRAGGLPVRLVAGGFSRDHESYVVNAVALGRKSGERRAPYWPRASLLRRASPGGAEGGGR